MHWYVYRYNINTRAIEAFNIFDHCSFNRSVEKILENNQDYEEFAIKLRNELIYYFWCKSEYEIVITAWCGGNGDEARKIDIYSQVMNNWGTFSHYVWNEGKKNG